MKTTNKTFYAPTFLDHSRTYPDKKGNSKPTGKLEGMIFLRTFTKKESGKGIKFSAKRDFKMVRWEEDTEESKGTAIAEAIKGLEEMAWLDQNPPLEKMPPDIKSLIN